MSKIRNLTGIILGTSLAFMGGCQTANITERDITQNMRQETLKALRMSTMQAEETKIEKPNQTYDVKEIRRVVDKYSNLPQRKVTFYDVSQDSDGNSKLTQCEIDPRAPIASQVTPIKYLEDRVFQDSQEEVILELGNGENQYITQEGLENSVSRGYAGFNAVGFYPSGDKKGIKISIVQQTPIKNWGKEDIYTVRFTPGVDSTTLSKLRKNDQGLFVDEGAGLIVVPTLNRSFGYFEGKEVPNGTSLRTLILSGKAKDVGINHSMNEAIDFGANTVTSYNSPSGSLLVYGGKPINARIVNNSLEIDVVKRDALYLQRKCLQIGEEITSAYVWSNLFHHTRTKHDLSSPTHPTGTVTGGETGGFGGK